MDDTQKTRKISGQMCTCQFLNDLQLGDTIINSFYLIILTFQAASSPLEFLVYFYADREIVVAKASDIVLGEYTNFTLDDWRAHSDQQCVVKVLYNGMPYDACVLQVLFAFS